MYKRQKGINSDISSISSNKDLVSSSTMNSNDWHRLLSSRIKPGVTRKYRTRRENDNKFNIFSPTSVEDVTVTLQSYNDESIFTDNGQITITQSDTSKQFDSSIENSVKKDNHYIKNSMSNRSDDHITSLKRRVRRQQMRHFQNQATILQETTFRLPLPTDFFLMPYSEQAVAPRRYRSKESSCIVPLPPLMNTTRAISTHIHDIKLNLYGY